jgi:hypothetical protein
MKKLAVDVLFVVLMIIALPAFAADGDDAMFGLSWGMTPAAINALGVLMSKVKDNRNLETYTTASLPKNLSDIEQYSLNFSDGKLVKIIAVSKNITGDITGSDGKNRFEVLKKSLEEKYGAASDSYQSIGHAVYREYDEFYQCLAYKGCGLWYAGFKISTKIILLDMNGLSRGTGFIKLTIEASPQFSEALEKMKSLENKSDANAL